jgi:hypothetical protein
MAISCVNNLFFNGRMESKIGEANSQIFIFCWCEHIPHGYFIKAQDLTHCPGQIFRNCKPELRTFSTKGS